MKADLVERCQEKIDYVHNRRLHIKEVREEFQTLDLAKVLKELDNLAPLLQNFR